MMLDEISSSPGAGAVAVGIAAGPTVGGGWVRCGFGQGAGIEGVGVGVPGPAGNTGLVRGCPGEGSVGIARGTLLLMLPVFMLLI